MGIKKTISGTKNRVIKGFLLIIKIEGNLMLITSNSNFQIKKEAYSDIKAFVTKRSLYCLVAPLAVLH
jgi:hypothetical protein